MTRIAGVRPHAWHCLSCAASRRGLGCPRTAVPRLAALAFALFLAACTQEQQNKIGRDIQNWTGTNGVLEIYAGDKLVRRFVRVDKLSTALGTEDGRPRAYRFGYGVLDENANLVADPGEKKVYFEVGEHANYVFFENPR